MERAHRSEEKRLWSISRRNAEGATKMHEKSIEKREKVKSACIESLGWRNYAVFF